MKHLFVLVGLVSMLITSCSSVNITDRYTVPDASSSLDNKYIVIVRSKDADVRNVYESKMAELLNAKGIKATALTQLLPSNDPNNKLTEDQVNSFASDLKSQGYNGIMVTVLKNVNKEQDTYQTGGGDYYGMYPGYYYGFGSFYYNPWAYSDWGPNSYTTETYNVYQVQTNVYDLTRASNKQLIAVVSSEISDPSNFISLADDFCSKVVNTLVKSK